MAIYMRTSKKQIMSSIREKYESYSVSIIFILFIIYLLYNIGLVSDDFTIMLDVHSKDSFFETLMPGFVFLGRPLAHLLVMPFFYISSLDNLAPIIFLKIGYIVASFLMTAKFFTIFLDKYSSFVASFLFVFFPTHDSIAFWYINQNMVLHISFYLFAYSLAYHNRLLMAGIFSTAASFMSYGSTPIALSVFTICILKREYKKGIVLLLPNIVYCIFYLIVSNIMSLTIARVNTFFDIISFAKLLILQILSFTDAVIGPSFFFKILFSSLSNDIYSLLAISVFLALILLLLSKKYSLIKNNHVNFHLVVGLTVLLISSCGMYATTGFYPQLAFNLGNRTTIYGSLLIVYLLVTLPMHICLRYSIYLILFIAIVGTSVHWKQWHIHQMDVINNMGKNMELKNHNMAKPIYITGSQYSKMGPFSHIEFFSENWVVSSVSELALQRKLTARSLNKRFAYDNGRLINNKLNSSIKLQDREVAIYDSEKDMYFMLPINNLNVYISGLPDDKRHWTQMIENPTINSIIIRLMPRLQYAF